MSCVIVHLMAFQIDGISPFYSHRLGASVHLSTVWKEGSFAGSLVENAFEVSQYA